MNSKQTHTGLKAKAIEEFKEFWAIAIYLTLMFSAFIWYRRFVLSESGISYVHYGVAVIEALILAKVILIGKALGLGRRLENSRLIFSVLFKSVVFGVFVALFTVLEHVLTGVIHHETWANIVARLMSVGRDEMFARGVILTVTFIPFFAYWEADRVLGNGRLFALFFEKRSASRDSI